MASLSSDWQPAAPQTLTHAPTAALASRSSAATFFNSSMSTANGLPELLVQNLGRNAAQYAAVDHGDRRESAGAEATRREQTDLTIRRRFARSQAFRSRRPFEQSLGSFDVTGGAGTHHAGVSALRLHGEVVVERGRSVDLAQGQPQRRRDVSQARFIQVAERLL